MGPPTTSDFRALCVELTDCLEKADWPHNYKAVFQQWIDYARAALAEQPVRHTPIPMAERLPCLEDCDEQGRCWFHSTGRAWCDWYLLKASSATDTESHWLPANALPIPESP